MPFPAHGEFEVVLVSIALIQDKKKIQVSMTVGGHIFWI